MYNVSMKIIKCNKCGNNIGKVMIGDEELVINADGTKSRVLTECEDGLKIHYVEESGILSAIKKGKEWGFQCICGNDTRKNNLGDGFTVSEE